MTAVLVIIAFALGVLVGRRWATIKAKAFGLMSDLREALKG